jgi:hypothetical protein
VVECTGLENRNPGNWIVGSNPTLSASESEPFRVKGSFFVKPRTARAYPTLLADCFVLFDANVRVFD